MKVNKNEYSIRVNFLNKIYIDKAFREYDESKRIKKVNRIKNEIKAGTYNIDTRKLSDKLEKYIRKKL